MLRLRASRIADSGARASNGLESALEQDLAIKNGEVSVVLPGFATGDAYWIEITIRGKVPSTKPAATATASKNGTDNKTEAAR